MLSKSTIENLDLSSLAYIANPYPSYKVLRELETPYWLPFYGNDDKNRNASGMWLFARYDDVNAILQESRRTSNNIKAHLSTDVSTPFEQTMLQSM